MIGFEYDNEDLAVVEPMSLQEAKSWCRVDQDYPDYDHQIETHISSARYYLESQLNVGLMKRNIVLNWTGEKAILPLFPAGNIISVKEGDRLLEPHEYIVGKYREKTIQVKAVTRGYSDVFYSNTGQVYVNEFSHCADDRMFTVIYEAGYTFMPQKLREALALHIVYLFQNQGSPDFNESDSGAVLMASGLSKNLLL